MASERIGTSTNDPALWAEVTYRFTLDAERRPLPSDPDAARLRLEAGNRAFAKLLDQVSTPEAARLSIDIDPRDVGILHEHSMAPKQQPFAAVVGCADARVPVELIFSEGPNDLFVVRIAGNGLGDEVQGSLSYAVDHLKDSLRTIVVLGHSRCGAVSAAVDVHLVPGKYLGVMTQSNLRHILDGTLVVIQVGAGLLELAYGTEVTRRPGYRAALIEVAITLNAALTAHGLYQSLDLASRGGIDVIFGVYLLEERLVWSPSQDRPDWFGLAPAPRDLAEFRVLNDLLVNCPRIQALLDQTE